MAFFCDMVITLLGALFLVIRAEIIPFREIQEFFDPYTSYLLYGMVGVLILKYIIYEIRTIQDIRLDSIEGKPAFPRSALLIVFPLFDIARLLMALGVLSAIINRLVEQYEFINPFLDHIIFILLILVALTINYFCYDSETILFNIIPTAVLAAAVLIISKGMFVEGLKFIF